MKEHRILLRTSYWMAAVAHFIIAILVLLPVLLLLVLTPMVLWAEEATLTMAMRSFPPWRILNEDKTSMAGLDVEIVGEIASRMNLSLKFQECSALLRCLTLMQQGEIDVLTSIQRTPEREEYMFYMDPPYKPKATRAFYVQTGKGKSLMKYEDLYKFKTVGVSRGSKYFPRFDNDTTLNKYAVTSYYQALRMLSLGRVDVVPGTEIMMDYLIVENGIKGVEKAHYFFEENTPGYIAVSKKSPLGKRIDEFKKLYNQLMDEGVIDRIKKKAEKKWYVPRTP